ncbi:hypothetical protein G6549_04920 [Bacillus sp. MM2020_1]|nr:hypothetical protein [Bacillus sp. MM2020_1]
MRASQINGCAFCINMHTSDARKMGETEQRLYCVSAWSDCGQQKNSSKTELLFSGLQDKTSSTHLGRTRWKNSDVRGPLESVPLV